MKIEIHNRLGDPQVIECTRVIVRDCYDQPLAVSIEYDDHTIITAHADDPDFHQMLRDCGINKTVIVTRPQQISLPEIHFPSP